MCLGVTSVHLGEMTVNVHLNRGANLVRIDKIRGDHLSSRILCSKKVSVWLGRCLSIRLPGGICMLRKEECVFTTS